MAAKVDGKLDSLEAEQQVELAAGQSLESAEGQVLPDRTGELDIHAPSTKNIGADYGTRIHATTTRELGALNAETAKEEEHLSVALGQVGTAIADASGAVSESAKNMMQKEADESNKAINIVKNAKATSANAAQVYMDLHGHADDVRKKLDTAGKVVADMELAQGMADDPAFWRVTDELSTISRELKAVGMAKGTHSLVQTELQGELVDQEAELKGWSQQLAQNEQ